MVSGCGASSPARHSGTTPRNSATSHVFTIPAKLPPREKPAVAHHNADTAPAAPRSGGAPSDAEIQRELAQALGLKGGADVTDQAGLTQAGYATVPPSAPAKVAAIIDGANQVARAPYLYGGGHGGINAEGHWVDSAYDCSGSVSFALAAAGLLKNPLDSTSFMAWGRPGPGKWVTIFANHVHAFMVVAGLRFDTIERARTGTRWGAPYTAVHGFTVRHPPGL